MLRYEVWFIFLSVFCRNLSAYRILVIIPTGSISHQKPQQAISQELANRGHHLTVISPDKISPDHPNITQIDISFSYEAMKLVDLSGAIDVFKILEIVTRFSVATMDRIFSYKPVQEIFENKDKLKYDAVIVELFYYNSLLISKRIFNTTLIGLSSLEFPSPTHAALGNTIHPILHPSFLLGSRYKNPTFIERVKATYLSLYYYYWTRYSMWPANDRIIQKFFPNETATSAELVKEINFAIEGITPVLGNIRPLVPNTVQIGFLHIKKPQQLPIDLKNYLDKSKNGVVYVSFGSNVKSAFLNRNLLNTLIEVFKNLKYEVLWKYENSTLEGQPKNVKVVKWLPQSDLLAHANVKVFIMQGGQQSIDETIAREVPVIAIPFFGDQEANADKIQSLGFGLKQIIPELTVESLTDKIHEVINNPKYKNNIQALATKVFDTPMPPVDTAVWWIEYAIRNKGASHLKYPGVKMGFIEYYLVDIMFFHILLFIVLMLSITRVISVFKKDKIKTKND